MSRAKLLIQNMAVYGFGGIISKLIPLIMVPIITRLFPDTFYYGISDLTQTVISLFSALGIMGMYDAMYRMFFEKEDKKYKKDICSSAFAFTCITSLVVSILMVLLQQPLSKLFFSDSKYGNLIVLCSLSVLIGSTNSIVSAPTRMENKRGIFLLTNTLTPIIAYSIAIPLIIQGHYLIALPLATLISSLTIEIIFVLLNRKWFSLKCVNWSYIKQMLMIALPLVPNFIIYWIFSSSDRVMISNFLGPDISGVYAVGSKIGQISQLIYLAFAGGWQYFAFSIMKDKDNNEVISKIFDIMLCISLASTLFITSVCKFGVEILFTEEYYSGYICVPYLFLAPLLLMLFQIGSNQFLVIKKTWPNLVILGLGAIVNVVLNVILINSIGIEGASISTLIGYLISILLCVIVLRKYKLINISFKTLASPIVFITIFLIMRSNSFTLYYLNIPLAFCFLIFVIFLFFKDIKNGYNSFKLKRNKI